ncbi:hypothetical protein ACJZ2D_010184 [Fusarium nematophilum]
MSGCMMHLPRNVQLSAGNIPACDDRSLAIPPCDGFTSTTRLAGVNKEVQPGGGPAKRGNCYGNATEDFRLAIHAGDSLFLPLCHSQSPSPNHYQHFATFPVPLPPAQYPRTITINAMANAGQRETLRRETFGEWLARMEREGPENSEFQELAAQIEEETANAASFRWHSQRTQKVQNHVMRDS